MKLILSSLLVLSILVVGISQAEAYDGKIDLEPLEGGNDQTYGDKVTFQIFLFQGDLIENEPITITTIERETGTVVKTQTITPDNFTSGSVNDETGWLTEYVRDTTDPLFESDTVYDVIVSYDNVIHKDNFMFNPPAAQQAVIAGESFAKMEEMKTEVKEIPSWVKDIFGMYYLEEIDDETLINSLQYLIKVGIIVV